MDQTQAKPRRRRRWLTITAVALLLASVCWWEWPRGDARLVGKWQHVYRIGRPPQTTTFHSYGVVEIGGDHYRWWVEGDRIYRRKLYGKGGLKGTIADIVQELRERVTGEWHRLAYACSKFTVAGPDELTINNWYSAKPEKWTRIPE